MEIWKKNGIENIFICSRTLDNFLIKTFSFYTNNTSLTINNEITFIYKFGKARWSCTFPRIGRVTISAVFTAHFYFLCNFLWHLNSFNPKLLLFLVSDWNRFGFSNFPTFQQILCLGRRSLPKFYSLRASWDSKMLLVSVPHRKFL